MRTLMTQNFWDGKNTPTTVFAFLKPMKHTHKSMLNSFLLYQHPNGNTRIQYHLGLYQMKHTLKSMLNSLAISIDTLVQTHESIPPRPLPKSSFFSNNKTSAFSLSFFWITPQKTFAGTVRRAMALQLSHPWESPSWKVERQAAIRNPEVHVLSLTLTCAILEVTQQ